MLGDLTYEYDKNGNRITTGGSFARTGIPQAVGSTAYNAANQQTTFADKALTYDNNGNLQTITDTSGTTTYTWNARNQLVGISGPGVSASFVYDGLGRRESKTINGNLTEFLYDRLNPVQEMSGATVLANILPGLGIDEFLTRTDVVASVTSNFLTDSLGSPIAATDTSGAVQTEYTYEPFGKTTFTGNSNSSSYQYTGRENDGRGLFYYRARYYHPQLQRFASEDPVRFGGGDTNLYAYVRNSPVNARDPLGLFTFQLGINVSYTAGGGAASGFGGFVIDDHGNVGSYWGWGAGTGAGTGWSAGAGFSFSNANDICGIGGPFANVSAAGGDGFGGNAEYYTGSGDGPNGSVTGAGATFGFGGGASTSAQYTSTHVNPLAGRKPCK